MALRGARMNPFSSEGILSARREFLQAAAAIAAVTSTSALNAAQEQEPVKVAVIGVGARGSDLLRSLTTLPNVRIVALADNYGPHLQKAAKLADERTQTFANYKELLEKAKPAAVVIAVPLYLHYEIASAALDAGCHVFLEKTMTYSIAEGKQLAERVKQSGLVFQVGLQRRANPIYKQAAAMVQAGLLGQITAIKAQWHRNNNWRRPVPVPRGDAEYLTLEHKLNWRLYSKYSQGLMAELGSHQMDVANWLLNATPQRVLASGGVDYWRDGRDVHDNVFCVFDYELPDREAPPEGPGSSAAGRPGIASKPAKPGKHIVRVTYSSLCNNAYEGASELILGTRGSLFLTTSKGLFYREALPEEKTWLKASNDQNTAALIAGKTLKLSNSPWAHRGEPLEIDLAQSDDTRDELAAFLHSVRRSDPATICSVDEGLRDTATVLMANEALAGAGQARWPLN
jgi:predicted dehydrogenase